MQASDFLDTLEKRLGIRFYTGVPDSLLAPVCGTLYSRFGASGDRHVVAANEGASVGLAAGHYIATGRPALVYMQNSGIGNAVNPIASLLNEKVYGIPCVFLVGWRGEPEVPDEPQHRFQGEITLSLLKEIGLETFVLTKDTDSTAFLNAVDRFKSALAAGKSVAFVARKGALSSEGKPAYPSCHEMLREEALRQILERSRPEDIFVSTTGKTSREVFELREALHQDHRHDFLTVGSMGHSLMIAMGIAMSAPKKTVWCLDGDGAAMMHMGSMVTAAESGCSNFVHVLINNACHESVGGMPVGEGRVQFSEIAKAAGYLRIYRADSESSLNEALIKIASENEKPCFLEIFVRRGSRPDLGRPTAAPQENLRTLMNEIREGQE